MLVGLLIVPIVAYGAISSDFVERLTSTGVEYSDYMSLFSNGGKPYSIVDILSQLAWGLGYCGMPHILVRFMAVKNEKELKKSSVIAIVWVFLSLVMACVIGVVGRAFLAPAILEDGASESVFISLINQVFNENLALPFIGDRKSVV